MLQRIRRGANAMRIAVLGAGNVGSTLGQRWAQTGNHTVVFATRNPDSERAQAAVRQSGQHASSSDIASAARTCDVIVLATPWAATLDALTACGDIAGKVIIDATNPILPEWKLAFSPESSGAEHIAAHSPVAHVVKAFNTVGFDVMQNPVFLGHSAAMLYCGDNAVAKATVASLIADLEFDPVDAGPLYMAGLLEHAALLWIRMSIQSGNRQFAFARLHR
jgi:hypothetical protein